jgi:hypothetical protein
LRHCVLTVVDKDGKTIPAGSVLCQAASQDCHTHLVPSREVT